MTTPTLTSPKVAALLGCSHRTVYAAGRDGRGLTIAGNTVLPILVGRRMIWPAKPIYDALNLDLPENLRGAA